jgi:transposase
MHWQIRNPLSKPLMGSGLIEVDNIPFEKQEELFLMENQEMIQAFSPHASQKAFADGANLTLIASLSLSGMGEALMLDGSADAAAFETYVEQILAPSLRPGQIVILDNLSIHQGPQVKQAIEARGCQLLFLPSYSPDLSPIEEAFSKLKAILRRVGARTREALQEAIIQALPSITSQDALGWFLHCGYPAPEAGEIAQHL